MDIYRNKKDNNLCICESCVKDQDIDLSEYEEYPFGECSICGTINEDARTEYEDWSAYMGLL